MLHHFFAHDREEHFFSVSFFVKNLDAPSKDTWHMLEIYSTIRPIPLFSKQYPALRAWMMCISSD